ncbi:MAG: hypothetical protein QOD35_3196 [Nocardioidaceae bacterium]|jgi:hypothetical protein|nr:hypothetical protein [Nocardioidaceae bacterium]
MDLSLRLILEIVVSAWLMTAMLVGVMFQAASRPSPGFALPLVDPTEGPYRFGVAASVTAAGLVVPAPQSDRVTDPLVDAAVTCGPRSVAV